MFLSMPNSQAYKRSVNYDESKVPQYELPDPLVFNDGKVVKNHRQWTKKRRAEIIEIFSQEMYGHIPARPEGMHYRTLGEETVYGGLGLRKVVRIYLDTSDEHWFDILIHLPAKADGPVPMFVGLNFKSNDATLDERADFRWPYEMVLKAGMGVATAWRDSIRSLQRQKAYARMGESGHGTTKVEIGAQFLHGPGDFRASLTIWRQIKRWIAADWL